MTETAEQVLAEVAEVAHDPNGIDLRALQDLTARYLPKPEPDQLTLAARACAARMSNHVGKSVVADEYLSGKHDNNWSEEIPAIRAIVAREVAAAEPSDDAIERLAFDTSVKICGLSFDGVTFHMDLVKPIIRAALKGEVA